MNDFAIYRTPTQGAQREVNKDDVRRILIFYCGKSDGGEKMVNLRHDESFRGEN